MRIPTRFTAAALLIAAGVSLAVPAVARAGDEDSAARTWHDQLANAKDAPCRSNAACAAAGVVALSKGHYAEADRLADQEMLLAVADQLMADTPAREDTAAARIAMAYVHRGDLYAQQQRFPAARAWYGFALDRHAGDGGKPGPSTQRVLGVARERLGAIATRDVVATLPAGGATYSAPTWIGQATDVAIKPAKGRAGVYSVNAEFLFPILTNDGEPSANMGDLAADVRFFDGVARIPIGDDGDALDATKRIADTAPWAKDGKCLLELRLSAPETLTIRTIGDVNACGFGNRVMADGTYRLTATGKP